MSLYSALVVAKAMVNVVKLIKEPGVPVSDAGRNVPAVVVVGLAIAKIGKNLCHVQVCIHNFLFLNFYIVEIGKKIDFYFNSASSNTTSKNCQCGFSKRDGSEEIVRCNDVVGQQRPRCPCFRNNIGCSVTCRCINCGNIFGKHIQVLSEDSPKLSRKRRLDVTLTRERTSKIMKEEDIPVRLPWTTLETCSLVIAAEIAKLMGSTNVLEKNVFKIYDIMRNLSNINIGAKSFKQIQSKIYHLKSQQMSSR